MWLSCSPDSMGPESCFPLSMLQRKEVTLPAYRSSVSPITITYRNTTKSKNEQIDCCIIFFFFLWVLARRKHACLNKGELSDLSLKPHKLMENTKHKCSLNKMCKPRVGESLRYSAKFSLFFSWVFGWQKPSLKKTWIHSYFWMENTVTITWNIFLILIECHLLCGSPNKQKSIKKCFKQSCSKSDFMKYCKSLFELLKNIFFCETYFSSFKLEFSFCFFFCFVFKTQIKKQISVKNKKDFHFGILIEMSKSIRIKPRCSFTFLQKY